MNKDVIWRKLYTQCFAIFWASGYSHILLLYATWKVYTQYSFTELSMWLFPYDSTHMFMNTYNSK